MTGNCIPNPANSTDAGVDSGGVLMLPDAGNPGGEGGVGDASGPGGDGSPGSGSGFGDSSKGGCGCRTTGDDSGATIALGAGFSALAVVLRRRRRRGSRS